MYHTGFRQNLRNSSARKAAESNWQIPGIYMVSRFRLVEIKIAMQIDLIFKTVEICFPIPTLIG